MTENQVSNIGINSQIAKNAYEVVRGFCVANGGGKDYLSWEEITDKERQNTINAVEIILGHKKTYASSVHEAWIDLMISKGWTYGKEYDEEKKTDPNMIAYGSLPPLQRAKDKLFHYTVKIGNILPSNT